MTSRERFFSSVQNVSPDRIPMDLYGAETVIIDGLQDYYSVDDQEGVYRSLHSDFRTAWVEIPVEYYSGTLPDNRTTNKKLTYWGLPESDDPFHPTPYGDSISARPLQQASILRDIEAFHWPDPGAFDFNAMREDCITHEGFVTRVVCGPLFNKVCELFGIETTLTNLLDKPVLIEALADKIADFYSELYTNFFSMGAETVDVFSFWDDVATSTGLFFSGELWRKYFKEPLGRIFQVARKNDLKVQYHCCGVMKELIPDLIDIGMDILEPCQFHLPGMEAKLLKREYGNDVTFFGGINTSTTLPFGTAEEVRQEVRERIETVGQGGGYILAPDHVFQHDVPIENIIAMFDEGYTLCT